jgi:hypothetical protein
MSSTIDGIRCDLANELAICINNITSRRSIGKCNEGLQKQKTKNQIKSTVQKIIYDGQFIQT